MSCRDEYIYLVKVAYELCDDKNCLSSILNRFEDLLLSLPSPHSSLLKFICYRLIYTCFSCDDFISCYNYEVSRSDFWDIARTFEKKEY